MMSSLMLPLHFSLLAAFPRSHRTPPLRFPPACVSASTLSFCVERGRTGGGIFWHFSSVAKWNFQHYRRQIAGWCFPIGCHLFVFTEFCLFQPAVDLPLLPLLFLLFLLLFIRHLFLFLAVSFTVSPLFLPVLACVHLMDHDAVHVVLVLFDNVHQSRPPLLL